LAASRNPPSSVTAPNPSGQARHDAPLRGELVRQRREPGTAGQGAGIKGTAPRLGRHSHHLS